MNARNWCAAPWIVAAVLAVAACDPLTKDSPEGFKLPPGDTAAGQEAFVQLGCAACHEVRGVPGLPAPTAEAALRVPLGGEIERIRTYGMLVTSIIHPNHGIVREKRPEYLDPQGNSLMPDLTTAMTVRQLIDLVAFLEENYTIHVPDYPGYMDFSPWGLRPPIPGR